MRAATAELARNGAGRCPPAYPLPDPQIGGEDERYLFVSDVVPTAWQAVQYAAPPQDGSLAVLGLGPVGQMSARIGRPLGYEVFAVDPVPERRAMAERHGIHTLDSTGEVGEQLKDLTGSRGPNAAVDAVGMEAHGSPVAWATHQVVGALPSPLGRTAMETAGVDRLDALYTAIDAVRRGGTISISWCTAV